MARIKQIHLLLLALTCFTLNVLAGNQETVYVQTDRSVYISGETVYFKLHVLQADTRKHSNISKVGYIELRAPKSAPALKIRVSVSEGICAGSFALPDSLHSGVYQLVAFTSFMKNGAENYFFSRELVLANRLDKSLNFKTFTASDTAVYSQTDSLLRIQTDKSTYAPGEKVSLRLSCALANANLAISVYEAPQVDFPDRSMAESLLQAPATTNYLTTRHMPERQYKVLRGKVLGITSNQCIPDAIVLLSCPDTVANLQYAITDADGLFQLQLSPYYDGKELFLSIHEMPAEKKWKIELEDNFNLSSIWKPELDALSASSKKYLLKSQDIASINKTYAPRAVKTENAAVAKAFRPLLYHREVKPVYPSDFVPLDSFPEIAVEILPTVKLYKQEGNYHARTITREQQFYGRNDLTFFLDGVYLDDINKITALNSEKIRKIEVLEDKRAFGNIVFYGIVSIQTKTNEILNTVPGSHSLRLRNDSATVGKSFVVQLPPTSTDAKTPYFKQLLYWNPTASLQREYTFPTSENTGTFLIKVEGIAQDGTPLSAITSIQVNNPNSATDQ
jgi:hypothetical protein